MVSLVHSHRRASAASNRSSVDDTYRSDGAEDETVVEPDQGNVLSHIISQLRPGADLSRVVLPTFILEPRSMLERITNFMAHPETLLLMPQIDDPVERFVSVVKFYLSGWHIKPPGVKKPLNPILGETYTCYWDLPNNTKGYYISEQTSHHPPKSGYFYMAPEHHIRIDGCLQPRSKFLGNSAASLMEGLAILRFLNRGKGPKGESYFISQPNMYARGILFGKMKYELGDHSFVKCPELGLSADVEFKTKGYFSGTYNAIGGTIKNDITGEILYELSGMWSGEMFIKDVKTGKKDLMFNAAKSKHTPPTTRPLEEQEERESQKLWYKTAQAVIARDHLVATDEKTKIEDTQRDEAARRAGEGVEWRPRLFRRVQGGPGGIDEGEEDLDWILNANIDGATPQQQVEQILSITPILPGQKSNEKNPIPPSRHRTESLNSNNLSSSQQLPPAPEILPGDSHPQVAIASTRKAPNDLIDAGQKDGTTDLAPQQNIPADLYAAQTRNGGQQQKAMESTLRETSKPQASRSENEGSFIDVQGDLKKDLSGAGAGGNAQGEIEKVTEVLKRHDTDTNSLDVFVDAEG